ncbi:hypothetical protein MRBLWH7_000119 [Microbacterium sp. LWH7-1.2]|uniref:hypothetical protein n=1 Tax=Microbacterium sp. LWH7-1.2 TaxID=3135257 RepID=UPI00313A1B7E
MARTSTIKSHARREDIERDIALGVPIRDIAQRYSLSASAVARHKLNRHTALVAAISEDGPAPDDVMGRLRDLADSTRQARLLADATASPAVRARVASSELAVLDRLVDRLGLTDLSAVEMAQAVGELVRAVDAYVQAHPDHGPDLFDHMGESDTLIELRDAMRSRIGKKTS